MLWKRHRKLNHIKCLVCVLGSHYLNVLCLFTLHNLKGMWIYCWCSAETRDFCTKLHYENWPPKEKLTKLNSSRSLTHSPLFFYPIQSFVLNWFVSFVPKVDQDNFGWFDTAQGVQVSKNGLDFDNFVLRDFLYFQSNSKVCSNYNLFGKRNAVHGNGVSV